MNFDEFKNQFEIRTVEEFSNNVTDKQMVSVCVQTYEHVDNISKCLDGILMQKTNFSYEILLGEDSSTDGTREICIKYAKQFPTKIRLFLHHRENNIKINGSPSGRFNLLYNLYSAQGLYISICEGDDYWIDSAKLQKQVDFLEANSEFSGAVHACKIEYFGQKRNKVVRHKGKSEIDLGYYLKNNIFITTGSLVFRKKIVDNYPKWAIDFFGADFILKYLILAEGKFKYFDEVMSIYNKGLPGSWSKLNLTQKIIDKEYLDNITALQKINEYTNYKFKYEVQVKSKKMFYRYLSRSINIQNKFDRLKLFLSNFLYFGIPDYKTIIKGIVKGL